MSKHQARKRFGQNFLVDVAVIDQIVRAIAPACDDHVVEIGPGQAALTVPLLERLSHLTAIEIDRDLAQRLRNRFPGNKLTVVEADVLGVDFSSLGSSLRLVGNLPYNISSPLLFRLIDYTDLVQDQHFMLQKEVVDRMVAAPGQAHYSRLSVMLQARYALTHLFDVPPTAFEPPPKVVSAIVRMVPLPQDRLRPQDEGMFSALVARTFGQRRKMLRRSLADWAPLIDWDLLGIAETARPESLSVAQFIALADHLLPQVKNQ
ncbi:MAG TPA: 16S rRNA (adenine(1518)-N(6)/adenine(1519)-N(6))-dimethyltransferase [Pusillimonas sp.]|jgi:16S rRNA (adenine1518-N6/adenine1519-N6)-dimethyltransferase|nr:16S rRNA (adenine(1518)-N(6)/adenine(1519)-N(6))-dimethyltransferase [Pusillimonas sp.]|tara:strand:- start:94935 stop:95720 length:786 start_codon:yes stop_codon:yes gene_type:complete